VDGKLTIFAFDLSGKPQWNVAHDAAWTNDPPGSRSTPVIDGDNLYIISAHGLVGCYDAKTGQQKWTRHTQEFGGGVPGWGYSESVLICGNLAVVTPGGERCMVALNKTTSAPVWSTSGWKAAAQYSSPYLFTHQRMPMIANGTGEGIVCVSPQDGRLLWNNSFSARNTANCPTPVYSDGYVFWANGYGKGGICLKVDVSGNQVSVTEAWRTSEMDCHHGGYIVHDGYIYGNHGGGWVCLDLKTGHKMWQDRGVGKGSICYADGMLYLFGENGGKVGLVECSPSGFQMKGSFQVQGNGPSWAHPVVAGGNLYLRYDNNLYCYDVSVK
jgi:outer membrane protein assembly factor BamB